jgi:predicted MFS family arabinose efflux permease
MTVATLAQFAIGTLAPFIVDEFRTSRAHFGLLSTSFFAAAALGSPLAGAVVDRLGSRRVLVGLYVVAACSFLAMAAAPTFAWLTAAVALGGMGAALSNPVTNQLIALHLPRGRQGLTLGAKQSGVQAGAVIAGTVLPPTATLLGWRAALLTGAVLALAGIGLSLSAVPVDATPGPPRDRRAAPVDGPLVGWLSAFACLMGVGTAPVGAFLVLYAVEELGYREAAGGVAVALMGSVGVVARICWGRAAERFSSSTLALTAVATLAVVFQCVLLAAVLAPGLLWIGVIGLGASATAWNVVGMLAIVRQVDRAALGRASGHVQGSFYIGLVISPALFGAVTDRTGSYVWGWTGVAGAFGLAALLALAWHMTSRRGCCSRMTS